MTDQVCAVPTPSPISENSEAAQEEQAPLGYRLLTGPDDREFCEKVSNALADGYILYGSPALTFNGERVIAAQAVILPSSQNHNAS